MIPYLSLAVLASLVARKVGFGVSAWHGPRALALDHQRAKRNPHVAHFAPEFAPAITDDPVRLAAARGSAKSLAPSNHADDVVNT